MSFVYFGLMLNTEHLSGNIFLNFFFGALVEIPAYIICILLLNRVGRKKLYIAFMTTGGICDFLTIFPTIYASEGKQKHPFFFLMLFDLTNIYSIFRSILCVSDDSDKLISIKK